MTLIVLTGPLNSTKTEIVYLGDESQCQAIYHMTFEPGEVFDYGKCSKISNTLFHIFFFFLPKFCFLCSYLVNYLVKRQLV